MDLFWFMFAGVALAQLMRWGDTLLEIVRAHYLPKDQEEDDGLRPEGYPTSLAECATQLLERENELRLIRRQVLAAEPHIPKGVMVCDDLITLAEPERPYKVV